MTNQRLAYLALSLAALFWSGNFIAGRALRDVVDPLTLTTLRWSICLVLFLPLIGHDLVRSRRAIMREWRLVVGLGATGIAAFHAFVYFALLDTTAINALLIISLLPAAILIGAVAIGESRPTVTQWSGAVLSMVGAGVLITRGRVEVLLALQFNRGDLWMLGAIAVWAVYSLLLRKRPDGLSQEASLGASIAVALIFLVPAMYLIPPAPHLDYSVSSWAIIFYIAVFASLLAYRFWSYGVAVIGPARAGQFVHLMPVFGPVLAVALLGETIALAQVMGAGLVLAGVVLVNRQPRG